MAATLFSVPGSHPSIAAMLMLDYKGIEYRRVDFVPPLHRLAVRAVGFRGRTVPALRIDGRRLGTAAALAALLLFFPIGLLWPSLISANEIFVVGLFHAVLPKAGGASLVIALSGLIALTAAGALARHDRRPAIGALALMGLGVLGVPVSGAAAAIAAMLACIVLLWPPSANDQPAPKHGPHR